MLLKCLWTEGKSHADSAATWTDHWAMAARARSDIGASRSLPPFPRKIRKGRSVAMDLRGNETRSEEHTSELQSLMRISYAVFFLQKKIEHQANTPLDEHPPRTVTQRRPT